MGYRYAAATVLAFAALALTSVGSNPLEDSRSIETLVARQAPILARLTRQSPPDSLEHEVTSLEEKSQNVLVKMVLNILKYLNLRLIVLPFIYINTM